MFGSLMLRRFAIGFSLATVVSLTVVAGAIAAPPGNTAPPTISGTPAVGSSLSAIAGSWSGSPSSLGYQWKDCSYSGSVLADRPVAYWRLGEASTANSVGDVMANSPGTYHGGVTAGVSGALTSDPDTSVTLDGSTGYASIPDSAALDQPSSTITLEALVNPTSGTLGAQKPIVLKSYTSHVSPYYQYGLFMNDSSGNKSLAFWLSIGGTSQTLSASTTGWTYGSWNDIVATYDGSTMKLYVNGTQVGSRAQTGTIAGYATPVDIGAYENLSKNSSYLFGGGVDEVAIYDKALSATAVEGHFTSVSGGCTDISGATGTSYTVGSPDLGKAVVVAETATNGDGSTTQVSAPTLITSGAPINQIAPAISGTYGVGNTLSVDNGTWSNSPTSYGYQWERCGYAATVTADNPAAYWRFDDQGSPTTTDETPNANNGTYAGTTSFPTPGALSGDPSQYANLDGSSGYASIPNATSLNPTSAITLEAWFKPTTGSVAAQKPILLKAYTSYGDPYYQYGLLINDASPYTKLLSFALTIGGGLSRLDVTNSGWVYNAWNYVAATYDGSTMRLYLNGTQIGSKAQTGSISTYATPVDIGAYETLTKNSTYLFGGGIDETAVYPTALSSTAIANHYSAAAPSCAAISGATSSSYTVASGDSGASLFVKETATNSSGSTVANSSVVSASQISYPYTTHSYYEHSASPSTLWNQGCAAGNLGSHGLVILSFGRPAYDSTTSSYGSLDYGNHFDSFAAIETAVEAYISGFWDCTPVGGPFTVVGLGITNNCPSASAGPSAPCNASSYVPPNYTTFGNKLADAVSVVQNYITRPPSFSSQLAVVAADDAEPAWDPDYTATHNTIAGYTSEASSLSLTNLLYDFGSLESGYWTSEQEYYVAFLGTYEIPLPQIYYSSQAGQWADLNSYVETNYSFSIFFGGVMNQWNPPYTDCGYTPHQGYAAMLNEIKNDILQQKSMKYLTDIYCHTS
jgi:Concanavalin A-like lectin/glucanases superfamily